MSHGQNSCWKPQGPATEILKRSFVFVVLPQCAAEGSSFIGGGSGGQGADAKSGRSIRKRSRVSDSEASR